MEAPYTHCFYLKNIEVITINNKKEVEVMLEVAGGVVLGFFGVVIVLFILFVLFFGK